MRLHVISATTALAAAVALALTAGAFAANGTPCNASPVFAAWGDTANYVALTPVGGGNASRVVVGPAAVTYKGSCAAFLSPDVRLIARNVGNPSSTLNVSVRFRDATGPHEVALGALSGSQNPSPILHFDATDLRGPIAVTLTATGPGARWLVSGVYVDPYKHR
jgi:hypothetical protein